MKTEESLIEDCPQLQPAANCLDYYPYDTLQSHCQEVIPLLNTQNMSHRFWSIFQFEKDDPTIVQAGRCCCISLFCPERSVVCFDPSVWYWIPDFITPASRSTSTMICHLQLAQSHALRISTSQSKQDSACRWLPCLQGQLRQKQLLQLFLLTSSFVWDGYADSERSLTNKLRLI